MKVKYFEVLWGRIHKVSRAGKHSNIEIKYWYYYLVGYPQATLRFTIFPLHSIESQQHCRQNGDVPSFKSERCFWQPFGILSETKVVVCEIGDLGRDSRGEERRQRQKNKRDLRCRGIWRRGERRRTEGLSVMLEKLRGRWRRTLTSRQCGFCLGYEEFRHLSKCRWWLESSGGLQHPFSFLTTQVLSDPQT